MAARPTQLRTDDPRAATVVVVGSANIDISMMTAVLPRPGETVAAQSASVCVGGKGANQAVAAAVCGASTQFVGRVGNDGFGRMVRAELEARGVGLEAFESLADEVTGLAAIYVDATAQNCIVVAAGANARLRPADVDAAAALIRAAALLVVQCESPPETVTRAVEIAAAHGVPVLFNPAPSRGLDLERLPHGIAMLVPNESEAAQLCGMPVDDLEAAKACAQRLRAAAADCVIMTLGSLGCIVADATGTRHIPAHPVTAVDATGAGDAFIGCLAASLACGRARDEAISRAAVYASLSTTRRGAQASYPTRSEFEGVWSAISKA